jgi:hypothetical protein
MYSHAAKKSLQIFFINRYASFLVRSSSSNFLLMGIPHLLANHHPCKVCYRREAC